MENDQWLCSDCSVYVSETQSNVEMTVYKCIQLYTCIQPTGVYKCIQVYTCIHLYTSVLLKDWVRYAELMDCLGVVCVEAMVSSVYRVYQVYRVYREPSQ